MSEASGNWPEWLSEPGAVRSEICLATLASACDVWENEVAGIDLEEATDEAELRSEEEKDRIGEWASTGQDLDYVVREARRDFNFQR